MQLTDHAREALYHALDRAGQRPTKQREHVFAVLLAKRDHPTADEVFARARDAMPGISLATVYNCLETLVEVGLVRPVNVEREPSRYCPNLREHAHFVDHATGRVYDVDLPDTLMDQLKGVLPVGYVANDIEISFHGHTEPGAPAPEALTKA